MEFLISRGLYAGLKFEDLVENKDSKETKNAEVLDDGRLNTVNARSRPEVIKKAKDILSVLDKAGYFPGGQDKTIDVSKVQMFLNDKSSMHILNLEKAPDCAALKSISGDNHAETSRFILMNEGKAYIKFNKEFRKALAKIAFSKRLRSSIDVVEAQVGKDGNEINVHKTVNVFTNLDTKRQSSDRAKSLGNYKKMSDMSVEDAWLIAGSSVEIMEEFLSFYIPHIGGWEELVSRVGHTYSAGSLLQKMDADTNGDAFAVSPALLLAVFNVYCSVSVNETTARSMKTTMVCNTDI
ncbi:MAG: hypothetical protein QS721_06735 [Candidatus Endonucleobacter sp. (ex Gigantidas childressi)]|nr:hypothetical protein [Candidatus Endonucleobacter sp. (ex Gigantidas childressi)]